MPEGDLGAQTYHTQAPFPIPALFFMPTAARGPLPMNVDSLTLYAYADKSQARERELWKRFLQLLLPVLLEVDANEMAEIFDEAGVDSAEDIIETATSLSDAPRLVRVVSGALALALGLPAEFGLAAFLDSNPPTRIHAPRAKLLRLTDEELMTRWLARFTRIQDDDEFLQMAADWKVRIQAFARGENAQDETQGKAQDGSAKDGTTKSATSAEISGTPRRGSEVPDEPVVVSRRGRKKSA